jgi:hypothetical protein
MIVIDELENGLIVGIYKGDKLEEEIATNNYKTKFGSYEAEINFIDHDWCYDEYEEYDIFTPTSSARIDTFYDKITIDNLEGIFVDLFPLQDCMKTIIGYKGEFYRGFEVIFKRRGEECENLESFKWSSRSLLKNRFDIKQVNLVLGKGYSHLNYYEYDFFDNTDKSVFVPSMYKIGTPLSFTLEDFKVKGQVNMNVPCQISFTYFMYKSMLEVKVNNIIFYVEKNLKFTVNNKVANFEIIAR